MPLGISNVAKSLAPSATLAMDAKAKALRLEGHKVIGFAAGEPDFDTPLPIRNAAKEAMDMGMTRYTPVAGTMELRNAIVQKLRHDNGLSYEPADIVVSNGAKHSLSTIFQTILNQGDQVIIPTPCWVSYPEMVRMAGGVPVFVETKEENGFIPTLTDIRASVTDHTKAFILTTPSNPNGGVFDLETLQGLAELCVEQDFYIVSDEIYEKLIYDGRQHVSIASLGEEVKARTLLVNGVSKTYAMTGFRIGYTAGPRDVIAAMTTYQSQATSAPNSAAQHAAACALTMDQGCVEEMRKAFEQRRNVLCEALNAIEGISCLKPQGAFYVMMNVQALLGRCYEGKTIATTADFANALLSAQHVAVVPGNAFMAEGYCRLSYATGMEDILEGARRIADFARQLETPQEVYRYANI